MKSLNPKLEVAWTRWILNTARSFDDFNSIIKKTNFSAVDSDHKIWIDYCVAVNDLIVKMNSGLYDYEAIEKEGHLFQKLYEYTQNHFSREEKHIKQFRLTGLELQEIQHKKILNAMKEVLDEFSAGKITVSQKLKLAVLEWGIEHINSTDFQTFQMKNFLPFFNSIQNYKDISPIIQKTSQPVIDIQHQQVTQNILNLVAAIEQEESNSSSKIISDHFTVLRNALRKHFDYEENFMRGNKIPTYTLHKNIHDSFYNNLDQYLLKPKEFKYTILSWWISHINEVDCEAFTLEKWGIPYIEQSLSAIDLKWLIAKTHIPDIDRDHFEFIEYVNQLVNDSNSIDLLDKIYNYAERHFKKEEQYMINKGITDQNHAIEHLNILSYLAKLKNSLTNNLKSDERIENIRAKVLLYWINHINTTDSRTLIIYE